MCVRVLRGRREERKGALLFVFTAHRDMITIVQSLTQNSVGLVLYTKTKAARSTLMWGSSQSYFLATDVLEGV